MRPTLRDALAFGVVVAAGYIAAVSGLPVLRSPEALWLIPASVLLILVGLLAVVTVRSPFARWFDPLAPWALLAAVALLREGTGGSGSRASLLVALPIVWVALFGRLWELIVTAVLAGLVYAAPTLLIGPPAYIRADWHRGLSWLLFGLLVGPTISHVVSRLREKEASLNQTVTRLDAMRQGARLAAIVATDSSGVIVDYNDGAQRLFGFTAAQIVDHGGTLNSLYLPDELAALTEDVGAANGWEALRYLAQTEADSRIWSHRRSDGTQIFARSVLTQLNPEPNPKSESGLLFMAIDATAAITSRHQLVAARDESDRLFEDSPQAIAVVDGATSELLRVNEAFAVLFDQPKADLVGQLLSDVNPATRHIILAHLAQALEQASDRSRTDWTFYRNGQPRQVLLSSTLLASTGPTDFHPTSRHSSTDHRPRGVATTQQVLVTMTDISTRYQYEQQLSYLADHDTLTGLANRRLLHRRLSEHVEADRRTGWVDGLGGSLLVVDLDHFKEVNDDLGHAAGDDLLVEVAHRMTGCVRSDDVVARLGGDEFAVLLTDGGSAAAQRTAAAIVSAVRELAAESDGPRRHVTASVGVVPIGGTHSHDGSAHGSGDGASAEELLSDADITMYRAKEAGRDQYSVKGVDTRPAAGGSRFAWRSRLTSAIQNDRLVLHLQPVRSIASGQVNGAEALLRLADTDQLVYPNEFLPVAERSDLIVDLDEWVLRRSITLLAELQALHPGFRLEMNLSGRSIGNSRIEQTLSGALSQAGCDARGLIIEITETAAIANVASAREFAERVMSLGCRFALDDFGAGYGSFYYLKHLLFDYVKIDGEFISRITEDPMDQMVVRSIVGLAQDLGKKTVAEYVENDEIYQLIAAEGVDYAQGYGVGRPLPVSEFITTYLTVATASTGHAQPVNR